MSDRKWVWIFKVIYSILEESCISAFRAYRISLKSFLLLPSTWLCGAWVHTTRTVKQSYSQANGRSRAPLLVLINNEKKIQKKIGIHSFIFLKINQSHSATLEAFVQGKDLHLRVIRRLYLRGGVPGIEPRPWLLRGTCSCLLQSLLLATVTHPAPSLTFQLSISLPK